MANQQRMLQSRFPPARARDSRDEDVRSESSWSAVTAAGSEAGETMVGDAAQHGSPLDPIGDENQYVAPPTPTVNPLGQPVPPSSAPVNQAARNLVDHANELPAARRLRRQQEQAQRRGRRGIRYGQMGAYNACNAQLPASWIQGGRKISACAGQPGSSASESFSKVGCLMRSSPMPMLGSMWCHISAECGLQQRVITATCS